jgi:hypothetical protein
MEQFNAIERLWIGRLVSVRPTLLQRWHTARIVPSAKKVTKAYFFRVRAYVALRLKTVAVSTLRIERRAWLSLHKAYRETLFDPRAGPELEALKRSPYPRQSYTDPRPLTEEELGAVLSKLTATSWS